MNHISFRRWCIKRFFKNVKDVCMIPFAVLVLLIAIFIISGLFLPDIFYAQSFVEKGFIGAGIVSGIILLISGIYIYVIQSIIGYRDRLYLKYKEESSMNKEVKQ